MKRVLVTGANGQLGLALQGAAKDFPFDLVFLDKNTLDITDAQAVKEVFASQSFDVCINAAAYTDVDGAETNKEFAYAINATAVETLAKACKRHGCWLVHISTDYVFDGTLDRPYTPSDAPNPLNVYGASKLAGEQAIALVGGTYSIVRTSWLYSQYGNNFYTKIQAQLTQGKSVSVTADQWGCPTRSEDLAKHLLTGISQENLPKSISHFCGPEVMTWLDLARKRFPMETIAERPTSPHTTARPKRVVLHTTNQPTNILAKR
jgi:dTDP-4-dehydrorhamnose reductase